MGSNQSKQSSTGVKSSNKTVKRSSWNSLSTFLPQNHNNKRGKVAESDITKYRLKQDKSKRFRRFSFKGNMAGSQNNGEETQVSGEPQSDPSSSSSSSPSGSSNQIKEESMRDETEATSSKRSRKRRTRSSAGLEVVDYDNHDSSSPITRRLRRRKDDREIANIVPIAHTNKGKERSNSIDDEKKQMGEGSNGAAEDMQIDQMDAMTGIEPHSSQHASTSNSGLNDAQVSAEEPAATNVRTPISTPPVADGYEIASNIARESNERIRREIERSIGTADVTQRILAQQRAVSSANSHPSMLSALLSDILGLRGARAGQDNTATSNTTNASGGSGSNNTPTPRTGGTSVIVQGALVSRTVPTNRQSSNRATEQNVRDGDNSSNQNSNVDSTNTPTPPAPVLNPPMSGMNGEAQAATIEEQASMLVRLLSIATAATAASLLSNPNARGNVVSTSRDSTAPSSEQRRGEGGISSVLSRSTSRPMSSTFESPTTAVSNRDQVLSNTSPASSRSAWASNTIQALRSRISSFGNRLRGRSATLDDISMPNRPSRSSSESALNVGQIRRALVAAREAQESNSNSQMPPPPPQPPSTSEGRAGGEEDQPTLASLSNMLRDAIRENLSNVGRPSSSSRPAERPSEQQNSTTSTSPQPSSSSSGNDARSRSRAVQATLEAVREGQLTPGEEGSFNRFLFDLSNDLNVAVRGMPSGVEDEVTATNEIIVDSANTNSSDEITNQRRQSDIRDGQLSFFRFFTFPEQRLVQSEADSTTTPTSLLPCIVVGVRSLEANEMPGADTLAGTAHQEMQQALYHDPSDTTGTQPSTGQSTSNQQRPGTANQRMALEGLMANTPNSPPMSRFLLFVSGGHYPPQHPLFHASNDEASRDLMVLMEFLGAMAAVQIKTNTTVTADQIAKSNLRTVNGNLTEIETLTKLHQIMENTSERCLICLEDWQEEGDERRLLDCGHLFHSACIDQWLTSSNNSCPLCRRQAVAVGGSTES